MPCLCNTVSMISIYTFRGVVQLFNAVKQQQGKIKQKVSEVKKSVRKTDKVSCIMFTVNMYLISLKPTAQMMICPCLLLRSPHVHILLIIQQLL